MNGRLDQSVAFDAAQTVADGYGGEDRTWAQVYACPAEFRYQRGTEAMQAGGLTGAASFKVRIRSSNAARLVKADDRMRDVRRGVAYNIREVDAITDRAWVWLVVENGVAI